MKIQSYMAGSKNGAADHRLWARETLANALQKCVEENVKDKGVSIPEREALKNEAREILRSLGQSHRGV